MKIYCVEYVLLLVQVSFFSSFALYIGNQRSYAGKIFHKNTGTDIYSVYYIIQTAKTFYTFFS